MSTDNLICSVWVKRERSTFISPKLHDWETLAKIKNNRCREVDTLLHRTVTMRMKLWSSFTDSVADPARTVRVSACPVTMNITICHVCYVDLHVQ